MRRQDSNLNEDVILFLGECDILTLNNTHQIAMATRTLLLKEDVLLTYHNPITSVKDSRLSRNKNPISLDKLTNHEYEYKITASMRTRLLIGRRDDGVQAYLKELKVQRAQKDSCIVAVINQDENFINGFVFTKEAVALDFYESLNAAIATQIYIQKLPESIPFNPKVINMLAETLNGRCCITPEDFTDGKQEEDQIKFTLQFLKVFEAEPLINFRTQLCQLQIKFRIIDDNSKDYAVKFLGVLPEKVERLEMVGCELTSNMMAQILLGIAPANIGERLIRLQQLNLSKNGLSDDVFTTLTKLLKSARKLQTLILNENSISFQKESILVGFLCSVVNFQLNLQLSNNSIHNAKHIIKYLINADGPLPLSELDISYNPIAPEELAILAKAYLAKVKQEGFEFRLHLNQLELQEPQAFEFLQEEYRAKRPSTMATMAIPMTLSKHVIRKKGKEIGSTEEELNKSAKIEELFRNYGLEVFNGNFFRLKKIKAELMALGLDEEAIAADVQKFNHQKQLQEKMIVRKMEACLNFQVEPHDILTQMNETLRFCRRKGLSGLAFNVMACIKAKIEALIEKQAKEGTLGNAYKQILYTRKNRFKAFYEQRFREDYVLHINLPSILQKSEKELLKQQLHNNKPDDLTSFMTYQYLLSEKPEKPHLFVIENCLTDPRMTSLKIARFQKDNIIQIFYKIRVNKTFLAIPEDRAAFIGSFGIETYKFSQSFIESGISSSTYVGILSRAQMELEQEKLVLAFIEISKNFLKYLYYTPQDLSEQTMIYLNSIVTHLSNLQNQAEDTLKLILAEELLIHMMTFFDSSRYQPLKPGLLTAVCEFIARRVALGEELLKRLAAFVLRTENGEQGTLRLHQAVAVDPWDGKVDWKISQLQVLRRIVLKRGKVQVKVADIAHPELLVTLEVDELDTVLDLWGEVKKSVEKLNEFTNISESNIDYYWLCGIKGELQHGSLQLLSSFEHIGKLIFDQGFNTNFYLRRVLYRPEQHSLQYLGKVKYEQLLAIYEQVKQSFKITATLFLSPEVILQSIILTIWADILLTDEVMLGDLRRQGDEQSLAKYMLQRERIVNDCMSKLYNYYVPFGFSINEAARNRVIFDIKSKQMSGVPKNINEIIKETVLTLIKKVGIAGYTTALHNSNQKFTMFINNHHLFFMDKSQAELKIIRNNFRNIIWFELGVDNNSPILKFEVAQEGKEEIGLHRFSIQGDSLWIGQCFALITQVARNRLSYPPQLLFTNEDQETCLSECPAKGEGTSLLAFPLLSVQKFFSFTLPRREEAPVIVVAPPPSAQNAPALPPKDPNNASIQQNQPSSNDNNLLAPEKAEGVEAARSSKSIADKNAEIEDIIKSAEQLGEEQEVVTSRRSNNLKKDVPRRRSRNR